jgi:hypothetical protein
MSPSLAARSDGTIPAYEMKFAVPTAVGEKVEEWAGRHLSLDPHADPALGNRYRITSVYFDTPEFDVFHRRPGFDVHKYRVRRYGTEPTVHLERKSKQDGRVWKHRATMPLPLLARPIADWPVPWFVQEITDLHLRPVCVVTYDRTALIGSSPTGPIRVTLDRAAVGVPTSALTLDPITSGVPLLSDEVVVELKYLTTIPPVFKDVIEAEKLTPTGLSKYRRCVRAAGLAVEPVG